MNETRTLQSLINTQCWTLYLNWTGKKLKTKTTWLLKSFQKFRTAVHFFPTCQALKAWVELSRVNLYRNDLKGNENYFELTGSRFELSSRG